MASAWATTWSSGSSAIPDSPWSATQEALPGGARRYRLAHAGAAVAVRPAMGLLRDEPGLQDFLTALLAAAPEAAFRWESAPVSAATAVAAWEFVLLDAPDLLGRADPAPFAAWFARARPGQAAVTFRNLGGDAVLVAPVPRAGAGEAELAGFLRAAPAEAARGLWAAVGAAMLAALGPAPVWLGTAGAGVAWPHVRLDSRPKYYRHAPYRAALAGPGTRT